MPRKINLNLSILAAVILPVQVAFAGCAPDRVQLKTEKGLAAFNIEVADTFNTRAKGLMFREHMARFSGMLFIYDKPQSVSFWMRNTLIPLDMIFLDQSGTVVKVHPNAVPLDENSIFGGDSIFAVLEINGGLAQTLGIEANTILQHPAFDPQIAAWPCKK